MVVTNLIDQIKPCPFCGGDALVERRYSERKRRSFVFVKCVVCDAQSKTAISGEGEYSNMPDPACEYVVRTWNMRVPERG